MLTTPYFTRPLQLDDAPSFLAAVRASLPELSNWMPWCKPDYALEDALAWINFAQNAWANGTEYPLGIFETSTGAVVGGTGINQINAVHKIANMGYWVSAPHTGRGVARLAARQAALLGFESLGLARIEIVTLTNNIASQRVALAVGAKLECLARSRLFFKAQSHDAMVYSLTPADAALWTPKQ